MGVKDIATIKYMRQNTIFADVFNYFIHNGEQVICPECLQELDTRELDIPYGGEKGHKQPVQRSRDLIKAVTAMTDNNNAYLLLAIENQSNIHYAMPVRNLVYDALQYAKQVEKAIASHKRSGDYKNSSSDEYLSGFMKSDRLMPVVTLVIYFSAEDWDAPMSIHTMFGKQDTKVLQFVPDYKINLIAPAQIKDTDFEKFTTSLKEVLLFIKYSADADKLAEVVAEDREFHHLGREEINVLNACVSANLPVSQDGQVVDVCKAIEVIAERAAEQERIDIIRKLMDKMEWTAEQAMDILSISEVDRELLLKKI